MKNCDVEEMDSNLMFSCIGWCIIFIMVIFSGVVILVMMII